MRTELLILISRMVYVLCTFVPPYVYMYVCMYVCKCVSNSDHIDRSPLLFSDFFSLNVQQVYKDSSAILYLQTRNNIFCFEFYKSVAVSCIVLKVTVLSYIVITFVRNETCRTLNICYRLQCSAFCYCGISDIQNNSFRLVI